MKKIDLFGRRLSINFEKKDKLKKEKVSEEITPREVVNEKVIYLILILVLTVISGNLYLFKSDFKLGDVIIKDVIAPVDIVYNDKNARERIVQRILQSSSKEYIRVENAEKETSEKIKKFFDLVKEKRSLPEKQAWTEIEEELDTTIDLDYFSYIFSKIDEELDQIEGKYLEDMSELYKKGVKREGSVVRIEPSLQDGTEDTDYEKNFLLLFIKPNYILDTKKTEDMLREKVEQVKKIPVKLNAGTVILKKGDIITKEKVEILRSAGLYGNTRKTIKFVGLLFYLLITSMIFKRICLNFLSIQIKQKNIYRAIFLILTVGIISLRLINPIFRYVLPIETVFLLIGILINVRTSLITGIFLILYSLPLNGFNVEYLIIEILSLIACAYLVKKIKNRTDIVNTGVYIGVIKAIIMLTLSAMLNTEIIESLLKSGSLFLSGAFTGMLTIALLPYFERTFNILTDIKLLELGDLSQPLLRRLSVTAPGTFHHSMMVATLSEQAVEAIGGNHVFARVSSYYHDIGKMKRPQFYVENQADGVNPHNNLSPSLSTLIITSHTKDGDDMGRKHNIPKEIRDIMYEHQGTTLLAYFYNKARKDNPNLEESDFRYSGPKPRSKESAVIMLADSIEAAVRSLDEKTPMIIEKMLRKIISSKVEEQQLSDANLTFKEIEVIIKTFTKVLVSIHHVRIKYPGQK